MNAFLPILTGSPPTSSGTPSRTYHTTASSSTDSNTYTFSAQAIGGAGDRTFVVILIFSSFGATGREVSTVTIDGNSASRCAEFRHEDGGTNSRVVALWGATVPTVTTADVVVTFNGNMTRCAIGVYTLKDVSSLTPSSTGSQGSDSSLSLTLDATAPSGNSVVIGGYGSWVAADRVLSWSGPTEDFEGFLESAMNYSGASGTYSTSGSKTITGTQSGVASVMAGLSAIFQ